MPNNLLVFLRTTSSLKILKKILTYFRVFSYLSSWIDFGIWWKNLITLIENWKRQKYNNHVIQKYYNLSYFEIIIKVLVKIFNLFQYEKTYPIYKQNVETISPSIFSRDVFFARRTICGDIQYRRPSPFYRCILVERTSTISYSLDTRYSQYPCIIHCHLDAYIFCRRRTSLEVSQNSLRKPDLVVKTIHSILCRYRFRE